MKNKDLLDSWKEISVYLERDIRTCMRWEKELGLPVHRLNESSSRAKVFAHKSEIDNWLQQKTGNTKIKQKSFFKNKRNTAVILAASICLSVCLVTLYVYKLTSFSDTRIAIAILPMENPNSTEYDQLLTIGLMNDLVSRLMKLEKFILIPITWYPEYRSSSHKNKNIHKKLNVDYILNAEARIEDPNIDIKVNLIRAKDDISVFDETYQSKIENLHFIQQDIFRNICKNSTLSSDINRSFKPSIYPFFDIYSQQQYFLNTINQDLDESLKLCIQGEKCFEYLTEKSNSQAFDLFLKALTIDNNCARANLGMARVYINFTKLQEKKNFKWLNRAEYFVKNAQTAEPGLPEYFSTLIEIYLIQEELLLVDKKDLIRNLAEKGLMKYPRHFALNAIIGQYYFRCFGETGVSADFTQALEMKKRAFLLNPFSKINLDYTELLMLQKNYHNAIKIYQLITKNDISDHNLLHLMQIYYYMGGFPSCKATNKQIKNPSMALNLDLQFFWGMMAAQEGNQQQALTTIRNINMSSQDGVIEDFYLKMASIYFGLGKKEKGFQYLDTFFDKPIVQKKVYIYFNYIDIDKNFNRYQKDIISRYKRKMAQLKY